MCGFDHVTVEEVVHHDRATHWRDADGLALDVKLVDDFGNQSVYDAMRATWAVVRDETRKGMRALEHDLLFSLGHATHPTLR